MTVIRIPNSWTPVEANAAITLIEAVLDALWRQYPEPYGDCFPDDLTDDETDAAQQTVHHRHVDGHRREDDPIPF